MDNLEILSLLIRSRLFEEKIDEEFKLGNLYGTTHLSIGQEASHTGLCLSLEKGDWFVPTHRCHGFNVASGSDISKMFSEMLGSRRGLSLGLGGSMHMTDIEHGNLGSSAVVGSGIPLALGASLSLQFQGKDNIAAAVFGDGASSRGTLHEAMNLASVWNLPILFYMENNHYGMSAASERMISTTSVASRSSGYGIEYRTVDGNDYDAVYSACVEARKYILDNHRPFFLETDTYRQCGHSKSDKLLYREKSEEMEWKEKDPIKVFVLKHDIAQSTLASLLESEKDLIEKAWQKALETRDDVLTLEEAGKLVTPEAEEIVTPHDESSPVHRASYREALREAIDSILSREKRSFFIGEDIGVYGGCFGVSGELWKKYGGRMRETPVSEETFTGMAAGAAFLGERPIVEIMYGDFLTLASDPLINHAAKAYFMSGGKLRCPMIVRTAMGGGTGHGAQHTQCLENMFLSVPGIKIIAPSDAHSAKAYLIGASYENCPVIFLEHKALYGEEDDSVSDTLVLPPGKALKTGRGKKLLVIGYSRPFSLARKVLSPDECTFLDIASLKPLDEEAVKSAASDFKSILILEDTPLTGSIAETVIRLIGSVNRDARIGVLSSPDIPLAFSRKLESETLPSAEDIIREARRLMDHE